MEEKEIDEKIEQRTGKIKQKFLSWLKDPYNKIFLAILILLIIFKLYWFFQTSSQPLWWDEADYMNIARTWLGYTYWTDFYSEWDALRPVLLPLIAYISFFLGLGEMPIRLFILFSSIASIFLIYGIGKQFFNKNVALFSAFMLAAFWSFSFYSYRLLVDVPVTFLWLASVYFFFDAYFKDKPIKHFILPGIFLGLAFLMKFTAVMLVFIFAAYLLITEKHKIFNKKIITFAVSSFFPVFLYMIWNYFSFGNPLAFYLKYQETTHITKTFIQLFIDHTKFLFQVPHLVFLILFIIGLPVFLIYVVLLYKKIHIKETTSNKYLFILLWIVVCLYFFARRDWFNYLDERYYFVFYPVVFLIASRGLSFIYDLIKKYSKIMALILIIIILGFGGYQNITHTNQIIEVKKESYTQLKLAGLWVNEHTNKDDTLLILEEQAEITYYAPRNYVHIGDGKNESFVREAIKEHKPKYAVMSFFFSTNPKYHEVINFVFSNPDIFRPVQQYGPYIDQAQKIPLAIVFEINPAYY